MADECNAIANDANVGVDPGIAAAVHDATVADEVVELLREQRSREAE